MLIILLLVIGTAALGLLVVAWIAYPRAMVNRGIRRRVARSGGDASPPPRISVILATREDDAAIARRIGNLHESDYPLQLLEVIVSLDDSVSYRRADLGAMLDGRARVVCGSAPGKAAALNAGVEASTTDLLLFIDSAQYFERDTITRLVGELHEPSWGALTATLAATSGDAFMDRYWQRELAIRQGQESRHSIICVTGCAYLMRRRFWRRMPVGLICDDLWSTYGVVTQGGRVGIVESARVTDPRRFTRDQEYARRLRTTTGMLQFVRSSPEVLSPSRNPMLLDFILHKLMRPATPLLLLLAGACYVSALWVWRPLAVASLAAAVAALALVVAGLAFVAPRWMAPRLAALGFAGRLMFMPLRAIGRALRSDWDVWMPAKT